jgi:hypothetical protein
VKRDHAESLRHRARTFVAAAAEVGTDRVKDPGLPLEQEALRFAAAKIREAGEAGTTLMADFVESLIVNLRG